MRAHHARTPRSAAFAAVAPTFAVAVAPAFTALAAARGDGGAKDDAGLELVPTRGAGDDAPPEAPSPDKKRDHFQLEIVDGYDAVPLGTTQNL